jgi:hypothetical protein
MYDHADASVRVDDESQNIEYSTVLLHSLQQCTVPTEPLLRVQNICLLSTDIICRTQCHSTELREMPTSYVCFRYSYLDKI